MNRELEFYMFISSGRVQTTDAAEGDYDSGTVQFGRATGSLTPFTLTPEDHADLTIEGSIEADTDEADTDSPVIAVTLYGLPDGEGERRSYFCRFDTHSEAQSFIPVLAQMLTLGQGKAGRPWNYALAAPSGRGSQVW